MLTKQHENMNKLGNYKWAGQGLTQAQAKSTRTTGE